MGYGGWDGNGREEWIERGMDRERNEYREEWLERGMARERNG